MDDITVKEIGAFEKGLGTFIQTKHKDIADTIASSGALSEDTEKKLIAALDEYAKEFVPSKKAS